MERRELKDVFQTEQHAMAPLLHALGSVGATLAAKIAAAGLSDLLGEAGTVNVQGESVQKLDVFANDAVKHALVASGAVCAVVSEEDDEPEWGNEQGRYVVAIDPLDGSSNIDVNVTIGTIFAVFERRSALGKQADLGDILRSGREVVAAGYVLYGTGTMMVVATASGVQGFTLDVPSGRFVLSHRDLRIPDNKVYSCNEAYSERWPVGVRRFLDRAKSTGFSARYIGSLVADFHRNLLKGGVFFYPADSKAPKGKLRLLYEGFPLAFVAEMAGGAATDGERPVLDRTAVELHERIPLVIGGAPLVEAFGRDLEA